LRRLNSPDCVPGPAEILAGETAALPGGNAWGQVAVLRCVGAATILGCPSPKPEFRRRIEGGDIAVSEPTVLTFRLVGPDDPRWVRIQ
jgi:hypothetical protein